MANGQLRLTRVSSYILFLFASVVVLLSVFKNSLEIVLGGGYLLYLFSFLLCIFSALGVVSLFTQRMVTKTELLFISYLAWLIFSIFLHLVLNSISFLIVGVIGFLAVGSYLLFFYFCFKRSSDSEWFFSALLKVVVAIGVINALGAIVQYFLSEDVFGLVYHSVYTSYEITSDINVSKRAVSFIFSPQSLSLYLAVCVGLALGFKSKWKYLIVPLLISAGTLTFSKAFFVFLCVYLSCYVVLKPNVKFLLLAIILCVAFSVLSILAGELQRVSSVVFYIMNPHEYSAFSIWYDSINEVDGINVLFGNGLGIYSRSAQEMFGYVVGTGSTESFFIQIYYELGLFGLFLFVGVNTLCITKLKRYRFNVAAILIGMLFVGLFTPALYGFAVSSVYCLLVTYGISFKASAHE